MDTNLPKLQTHTRIPHARTLFCALKEKTQQPQQQQQQVRHHMGTVVWALPEVLILSETVHFVFWLHQNLNLKLIPPQSVTYLSVRGICR